MHSVHIDKNFFSTVEHDFPEFLSCETLEEAKEKAQYYKRELEKIAQGTFVINWINKENLIHLNLSPLKRPDTRISKELLFTIDHLQALQEFWDYFVDENFEFRLYGCLEHIIHMFYGIAAFRLNRGFHCTIKIEESLSSFILTIGNIQGFSIECFRRLINREHSYKELIKEDEFIFFVPKNRVSLNNKLFIPLKGDSKTISFKDFDEQTLKLFSFLEVYEVDELIELISEFNSMVLILGSSGFDASEALGMAHKLKSMGKILIASHESYTIGVHIDNMARVIETNMESFIGFGSGMAELCNAFNHDLSTWVKKIFFEGAPSLHFLDDSLTSNCLTICQMLQPAAAEVESLDDIFDF